MSNDDLFPKPNGAKELRALLRQIEGADEQLVNDTRYKAGFEDGIIIGRAEAQEETKCLIRALMRLYDNDRNS